MCVCVCVCVCVCKSERERACLNVCARGGRKMVCGGGVVWG